MKYNPSKNIYPFSDSCDKKYTPYARQIIKKRTLTVRTSPCIYRKLSPTQQSFSFRHSAQYSWNITDVPQWCLAVNNRWINHFVIARWRTIFLNITWKTMNFSTILFYAFLYFFRLIFSCISSRNYFVKIGFISFWIIPFRFGQFRFDLFRFVSVNFVSFRFISFRFVLISFRILQVHNTSVVL